MSTRELVGVSAAEGGGESVQVSLICGSLSVGRLAREDEGVAGPEVRPARREDSWGRPATFVRDGAECSSPLDDQGPPRLTGRALALATVLGVVVVVAALVCIVMTAARVTAEPADLPGIASAR